MTRSDLPFAPDTPLNYCFAGSIAGFGTFYIRPLHLGDDVVMIHDWVNRAYARYWGMSGTSLEDIETAYRNILKHAQVFIGVYREQPAFLLECYYPENDPVGQYYKVQQGDRGMHILVAPPERHIAGFTKHIFTCIMDFI